MSDIPLSTTSVISTEVVITERVVSTEFYIREIHENVQRKSVRVDIELGPFTEEDTPDGTIIRGISSKNIEAWSGDDYSAIELTWNNQMLVDRIKEILETTI